MPAGPVGRVCSTACNEHSLTLFFIHFLQAGGDTDQVKDLYSDLTDGVKLLTLLRLFTGEKLVQ